MIHAIDGEIILKLYYLKHPKPIITLVTKLFLKKFVYCVKTTNIKTFLYWSTLTKYLLKNNVYFMNSVIKMCASFIPNLMILEYLQNCFNLLKS